MDLPGANFVTIHWECSIDHQAAAPMLHLQLQQGITGLQALRRQCSHACGLEEEACLWRGHELVQEEWKDKQRHSMVQGLHDAVGASLSAGNVLSCCRAAAFTCILPASQQACLLQAAGAADLGDESSAAWVAQDVLKNRAHAQRQLGHDCSPCMCFYEEGWPSAGSRLVAEAPCLLSCTRGSAILFVHAYLLRHEVKAKYMTGQLQSHLQHPSNRSPHSRLSVNPAMC